MTDIGEKILNLKLGERLITDKGKTSVLRVPNGFIYEYPTYGVFVPYKQEKQPKKEDKEINEPHIITFRNNVLKGEHHNNFLKFWEAFNYKQGRAEAAEVWYKNRIELSKNLRKVIITAKIEASNRQFKIDNGTTPIMAQGWLSKRRWENEETPQKKPIGEPKLKRV